MRKILVRQSGAQLTIALLTLCFVAKPNFFGFALITGATLFIEGPLLTKATWEGRIKLAKKNIRIPKEMHLLIPLGVMVLALTVAALTGWLSIMGVTFYAVSSLVGYLAVLFYEISLFAKIKENFKQDSLYFT